MAARLKGNFDQATATGWEARRFHYMQRPKPLGEYLKHAEPERDPDEGARQLREMIARRRAKKEQARGTR